MPNLVAEVALAAGELLAVVGEADSLEESQGLETVMEAGD
jgi:hypothetical protein